MVGRRQFMASLGGGLITQAYRAVGARQSGEEGEPFFRTRGVVLTPEDLTLEDWPERAKSAGLTTIALHDGRSARNVVRFVQSPQGARFLAKCRKLGLAVEYELHAMSDLLPRDLFRKNPRLFRMNEKGERVPDKNLCVHSPEALEIAGENALELATLLPPTSSRYFFWGDDAAPWCRCPKCVTLSDSDQALIVNNHLQKAIRARDPQARLAHLAYANTLQPPKVVKPASGVFLEFAPINRRYDVPFEQAGHLDNQRHLAALDANLAVFGSEGAQALEYWLDVSRFSHYQKPAQKLPFYPQAFAADLTTYSSRGIRHITSFAVYIDADYVHMHGAPPLDVYGSQLRQWHAGHRAPNQARSGRITRPRFWV